MRVKMNALKEVPQDDGSAAAMWRKSNAFISRVFLCQVLDVQSLIFPVAPGQMLSHFTANENWQ